VGASFALSRANAAGHCAKKFHIILTPAATGCSLQQKTCPDREKPGSRASKNWKKACQPRLEAQ